MEFEKILRRKRDECHLMLAKVDERIGIAIQNVNSYKKGYKIPYMRVVVDAADLFHCSTDEMLGGKLS